MNTQKAIYTINKKRLNNKNKWYVLQLNVNGVDISLKGYNTWIQRLEIGNLNYSSGMGISVSEFKNFLQDTLK